MALWTTLDDQLASNGSPNACLRDKVTGPRRHTGGSLAGW